MAIDDPYDFLELDPETRSLMVDELDIDIAERGGPYLGKTLSDSGREDYPVLLRDAFRGSDESTLVALLEAANRTQPAPIDGARRLGRTEFNRYYMRAICRRAAAHGTTTVVAYRAHESKHPRVESDRLIRIGEHSGPRLLAILREPFGGDVESKIGLPNSGLSLRCGCTVCLSKI